MQQLHMKFLVKNTEIILKIIIMPPFRQQKISNQLVKNLFIYILIFRICLQTNFAKNKYQLKYFLYQYYEFSASILFFYSYKISD